MHCDDVRTILLDYGWDADERHRAMLVLRHMETCDACRAAFADFDALRGALRSDGPAADAEGGAAPPHGWDAFIEKLATAPAPRSLRLRPRPSGGRAAALAACIVLAACAFQFGRRTASGPPVVHVPPPARPATTSGGGGDDGSRAEDTFLASLTPSATDAARQADAFERVSEVFDHKASWLMTSGGGASDVGLATESAPAGRSLLMLRLAVLHGGALASEADVVIVPGQSATLTLPTNDGGVLKYRIGTSAGEPTALTLWLEVRPPHGGEALAALATNLLVRPGARVAAGELATTAGKYELKVGFTTTRSGPPRATGGGGLP
jgi:hypothetical protein